MSAEFQPLPVASKYYGEAAKRYDERRQAKEAFHRDQAVLEAVLKALVRPGSQVLDVACGTNRVSDFVRGLGGAYHGIDISSEMVALARSKDPQSDLRVADARDIPHPSGSFDLVMTVKFLKWVPDDASLVQVLREIARVLRPGGQAILHQKILAGVRLSTWRQLRGALATLVNRPRHPGKKDGTSLKTRAVEESAFLGMCEGAGLSLKFVARALPLSEMLRSKRLDAFYVVERRA